MRYDERIIDQVQNANDIVEVIGQVLPLKRSGRNLKACCPFHSEKTPSFMVQPEKQIFHCFGCGTGGNVFTFLMKYENAGFLEVLRRLAERAGIVLPETSEARRTERSENEKLYEVYDQAAEFYHQQFLDPAKGKIAREYFERRGYTAETAAELKMGWAPDGWRSLLEYLTKKGHAENILLRSGLISQSQTKGTIFDSFRARLLFPIRNLQGKVVAFGGRVLKDGPDAGPKYLNSPENPIFHKRRELFGLQWAKKFIDRENPRLVVVEGYFDFLRLFQAGFKSTVATLGTALTPDHVQLLKRFAGEAIVVYDGDKAGEAASIRGLEVFLEGGMSVRIVRLPAGYDPDDYVEKQGVEAFQKLLDEAGDFFDFKLETLTKRFNVKDSMGLMKITNEFLDTFTKVDNPVMLDRYLRRLAGSLGVEENSLRSELAKLKKKIESPRALSNFSLPAGGSKQLPEEILLMAIAAEEPRFWDLLISEVEETDLKESGSRELLNLFLTQRDEKNKLALPQILSRITDEPYKEKMIAASSIELSPEAREKAVQDCLRKLRKNRMERKLEDLRRLIVQAEKDGGAEKLNAYAQEYQTLIRENRELLSEKKAPSPTGA